MEVSRLLNEAHTINGKTFVTCIGFDDWLALPVKFDDKDTSLIKYAARTEKKWLELDDKNEIFDSYIATVNVANVDGCLYKINGLIRQHLWVKELLTQPSKVTILIYTLDEVAYEELINSTYQLSLTNKSQSAILNAYKRQGLTFKSERLKHGYIAEALNIALRGKPRALQDKRTLRIEINIDKAIEVFKSELLLIDSINPDPRLFSTGIISAALIMLSIDPKNIEFFSRLNASQGEMRDDAADPVESLLQIIDYLKKKSSSESRYQVELCSKTIRAVRAWNTGPDNSHYWIKRLISADFFPIIRKMKLIKQINGTRDL